VNPSTSLTWDSMTLRERMLSLVTSETIDPDAWADHYLDVVVGLVEEIRAAGEPEPLHEVGSLRGDARLRLLQAVVEVEQPALVPELLSALQQPEVSDDEAELLIDHLRTWQLADEERIQLKVAAAAHLGRSKLLDRVIASL
jgi:hypothetical protein